LLPKDVGGHDGVTMCKKSPTKAAMAITAAKRIEVAALCHAVFAVADFATLFGASGSLVFQVKKLSNGIKDLKTVKSGDLMTKKTPSPPKNVSPPPLCGIR
jgi:hypothetical protein